MTTKGRAEITAIIENADVSGQVVVGEGNTVTQVVNIGAVVHAGGVTVEPKARGEPVSLPPRECEAFGRDGEIEELAGLLDDGNVEIYGLQGNGKTTLLSALWHGFPELAAKAVYVSRPGPAEDLLAHLFEAHYSCEGRLPDGNSVRFVPSPVQLEQYLPRIAGLVVIDHSTFELDDLRRITSHLAGSKVVVASEEGRFEGDDGASMWVRGLAPQDALALFEKELGRTLEGDERASAAAICSALKGRPGPIVQAAALVAKTGKAADDLRYILAAKEPEKALAEELRPLLTAERVNVLEILNSFCGASLAAEHIARLSGLPEAQDAIEALLGLRLIQAHSPRYSSIAPPGMAPEGSPDRAARYLAEWAREHRADPDRVATESEAVLAVLGALEDPAAKLDLAHAAEDSFLLTGRWGGWEAVIGAGLEAARSRGDKAAEARWLHQLGTRALCRGDAVAARPLLVAALDLRRMLGDADGAAVTEHNLGMLDGGPPPPGPAPDDGRGPRRVPAAALLLLLALLLGGGGVLLWPDTDTVGRRGPKGRPAAPVETDAAGDLVWTPAAIPFGSLDFGSRSESEVVTVTNRSGGPVSLGDLRVVGAGAAEFGIRNGCHGVVLDAGGLCEVEVWFSPRSPGSSRATIEMATDAGVDVDVSLSGKGRRRVEPNRVEIALAPRSIDFGAVDVDTVSAPRSVEVTHTGSGGIDIAVSLGGANGGDFVFRGCSGVRLRPQRSCRISVAFAPSDSGVRSARLVVTPGTGRGLGVALSGRGTKPPAPPPPPPPPPPTPLPLPKQSAEGDAKIEPYSGAPLPETEPVASDETSAGGSLGLDDGGLQAADPSGLGRRGEGGLPFTGADLTMFAAAGAGVIAAGATILRAERRWRRRRRARGG